MSSWRRGLYETCCKVDGNLDPDFSLEECGTRESRVIWCGGYAGEGGSE